MDEDIHATQTTMLKILITDGNNRSALAATRSLGCQGHILYVSAESKRSLAAASRYCRAGLTVPDPLISGKAYVAAIAEIATRHKIDVIFPMTEQSIYLLNPAREHLPQTTLLACPPSSTMMAVSNKYALFQLAEELKVPIPGTRYLEKGQDLSRITKYIERYPVVVKPAFSRIPVEEGFLSGGVRYARNLAELQRIYSSTPILTYPSLIQEKIEGPGTGLFTLYDRNTHLALFSHKRLREKPPSGGVSVVCESVPLDEEMVHSADSLLSSVDFNGVAMVEFKRDLRDGKAKLMEINGRFWGSLQLAITCGVDFPTLYLDYLQGNKPSLQQQSYPTGKRMKWFFGTLDHLLIRLKNTASSADATKSGLSRRETIRDFLKIWESNTSFDVANRKDMRPLFYETACYLQALWQRK